MGGEVEPPPFPEPRPGFCVSHEDMLMICAAGSAIEEKSPAAMEACAEFFPNPEEEGKGKSRALVELLDRQGKGKGKGGKGKGKGSTGGKGKGKGSTGGKGGKGGNAGCPDPIPSAEDILAELSDKFAAEICMFTSMGWIDTDKLADQGQITGDIMTLPNEISEALTGDDFTTCVEQFEADAMEY